MNNSIWVIRHKITNDTLIMPSKRSSWNTASKAKLAWSHLCTQLYGERFVKQQCCDYDVAPITNSKTGGIVFPKFDQQDTYHLVNLYEESIAYHKLNNQMIDNTDLGKTSYYRTFFINSH